MTFFKRTGRCCSRLRTGWWAVSWMQKMEYKRHTCAGTRPSQMERWCNHPRPVSARLSPGGASTRRGSKRFVPARTTVVCKGEQGMFVRAGTKRLDPRLVDAPPGDNRAETGLGRLHHL